MSVRVRYTPVERIIRAKIDARLSPQERSKTVARFARVKLGEAQEANRRVLGHVPDHEQIVNGRRGAALETAHPDKGTIVFRFRLAAEVIPWIMAELIRRSPIGPAGGAGTYREQHLLFADGVQVHMSENLPPAAEYAIINSTPYARKIEIGATRSGRPFVISAEPRLYDSVSHEAASRFRNIVKISYTFRPLEGGYQLVSKRGTSAMRYPTIIVRPA